MRWIKWICVVAVICAVVYGGGRLYYALTDGFITSKISSQLAYDPRWNTHALSPAEQQELNKALNQPYHYLGKGCQSYVFASQDGQYVIKFFKYQHFRSQAWIDLFTFIPSVKRYQDEKTAKKRQNLNKIFRSWQIAFDDLKDNTGVIFVHLNKNPTWSQTLTITDKIGLKHTLKLGEMEFLVQQRADMLGPTLDKVDAHTAKALLDSLLIMIFSEYLRGFADNDHALLQNTGVLHNRPIHIDVGQFIYNDLVKAPDIYKKELFDKTFLLHQWLVKHHPELAQYLRARLIALIGLDYFYYTPYRHKKDVGKIPNQE